RRLQRTVRHRLLRRGTRYRRRHGHQPFRPPAQARRKHHHRRLQIPGAARRQPARAYPPGRTRAGDVLIPPVRRKTLVAVAAGALSVAGFGDLPLWPLSLLAFAALLRLWHTAETPRQAAGLGYAWGVGAFLVGVSWVYVSLHDFGMMPAPLAAVATLLFCLYLALFPAAAGYLQAHLPGSPALRLMLYMPACWVLTEWLRGWLLTGFPWLAFGYSTVDTPLAAYAPLVGVYGLSLLAAIAMGALVAFMQRGHERIIGAAVFVALIGAGLTLRSVTWTRPVGAPISVSLLQGNIPQELKFVPGRYEQTLHTYARLARTAPAQLIVL